MMTLTDRAIEVVRTYMDQSGGDLTALRVAVSGGGLADPDFELTLVTTDEIRSGEIELDVDGLTLVVDEGTAPRLEDATVDFLERINESGFEVRLAPSSDAPATALTGALAEQVRDVLESQINPAIASHGGAITLVGVKATEIYLEMSGGCQGCAMSRMTLRQGVERMVRQAVPEITVIHDVTDHASGENPFFEGGS